MPKLSDPRGVIAAALARPIGAPALAELAQGRKSACILICDITRPVPNRLFLRPMVQTMVSAGIPLGAITILVATGLHRPNEGEELAELVGDPWVMANVRVENHFARDEAMHVDLGRTATRGTPIGLDRRFVEAGCASHRSGRAAFMAGWSGGRKDRTWRGASRNDPYLPPARLRRIRCFAVQPVGNPPHEEQLEIVRRLAGLLRAEHGDRRGP
jgi:nickel-dependent lactate racemase